MRNPSEEAVLAAYIAASGKRSPRQAAQDATELCCHARSLHRLHKAHCNYGLTPRQEARAQRLETSIRTILHAAGFELNHINGDPRGFPVYINLPDGSSNTWGGKEYGWGIG